jgi:hypothetical protein
MKWSPFTILLVSCPVLAPAGTAPGPKDLPPVERGTFILHNVLKPTGRETYEIARHGDRLVLRRVRREPATLWICVVKCAMHYHTLTMARRMDCGRTPIYNTFL